MKFFLKKWPYLLLLLASVVLPWFMPSRYVFQIVINSVLFSIAALSLNLILGYTGQMSLAHAGFFAIGAYGVALLTTAGLSFWLALPLSAALAAGIGFFVGLPALRTRGSYFAIATMCFGIMMEITAGNWIGLTGGHSGIVGIPRPTPLAFPGLGALTFESQTAQYFLVWIFLLFTLLVLYRLVFSLTGLSFMAVRNNEILAESLGINTFATKLLSFMVANFFAGLAGGIYAALIGSISPTVASLTITFNLLIFVLLGGLASLAGPILGTFFITILLEYLQFLQEYSLIFFGLLLILVIIYFPFGFMGTLRSWQKKFGWPNSKR
jgi:branched-chain amino acid transport system permease protein